VETIENFLKGIKGAGSGQKVNFFGSRWRKIGGKHYLCAKINNL
jgi:hypothetical protein